MKALVLNHFVTPNRSGVEFAKALFELAPGYPEAETIHLVMDNLSTHAQVADRSLRRGVRRRDLEPFQAPLHAEARQLVESGGDRDQPVLAPVLGTAAHPGPCDATTRSGGLESPGQSRTSQDRLAIRPQGRSP